MVEKHISSDLSKRLPSQEQFIHAKPFPHASISSFLKESFARQLQQDLSACLERKESDLFSFFQSPFDLSSAPFESLRAFSSLMNSERMEKLMFQLTGVKVPGFVDSTGFCYSDSDQLLPHDDFLAGRRIAFTLYLADNFSKEDGGQLDFFKDNQVVHSIIPSFNTLVLFLVSEDTSMHQVSEVLSQKKRYSLAGWFHD